MIENLLVDLDGTLVFTARANQAAYGAAFAEAGIPFDEVRFEACQGLGFNEMMAKMAPGLDKSVQAAVREAKDRHYPAFFGLAELNKSLAAFIRSAKSRQRTALVTTARRQNALRVLEHFSLTDLFDIHVFGDEVARSKPDPECYHVCLRKLGASPQSCLAFEDSEHGVEAALSAGIQVLRI